SVAAAAPAGVAPSAGLRRQARRGSAAAGGRAAPARRGIVAAGDEEENREENRALHRSHRIPWRERPCAWSSPALLQVQELASNVQHLHLARRSCRATSSARHVIDRR